MHDFDSFSSPVSNITDFLDRENITNKVAVRLIEQKQF